MARKIAIPGIQRVWLIFLHSRFIAANSTIMDDVNSRATGPLASTPSPRKKYEIAKQALTWPSYHAYHASRAIVNMAVRGMSVEAARA